MTISGRYYAGIGAQNTPEDIQQHMRGLAGYLAKQGLILRSGASGKADTAFEKGCDKHEGKKEIFLPWLRFNDHDSKFWRTGTRAWEIAEKHHPAWDNLSQGQKKLLARNVYIIEGKAHEELPEFVVCWTKDGKVIGGTGMGLRLAAHHNIPVFNFGDTSLEVLQEKILEHLAGAT